MNVWLKLVNQKIYDKLNPYLFFNGNCEEAFNFYKSVFRNEFNYLGRYKDVPHTDRQIFKENDEKIMHVTLSISEQTTLMGSDNMESHAELGSNGNFALYINTDSRGEADSCLMNYHWEVKLKSL